MKLSYAFLVAASVIAGCFGSTSVRAASLSEAFLVDDGASAEGRIPLSIAAGDNGDLAILMRGGASESRFTARFRSDGSRIDSSQSSIGVSGDAVAVDRLGNTVVVYAVPSSGIVYLRVYGRAGAPNAPPFRVDNGSPGVAGAPVVAMNGDGVIAVAWSNYVAATSTKYVYYRSFNRDGTPRTPVITVSSLYQQNQLIEPTDVSVDRLGNASVVFFARDSSTPIGFNVWMRRFNGTGASLGGLVRVNDASVQALFPRVATNPDGSSVVTWSAYSSGASSRVIMAQRYGASGSRVGGNLVVSNTEGNDQYNDVGVMDDGSFVVTWANDNRRSVPGSVPGAFAREYRNDGNAVGPEFRVSLEDKAAYFPLMAMDLAGKYTVSWRQYDAVDARWRSYARRYVMDTLPSVVILTSDVAIGGLSGALGSSQYFKILIPRRRPSFTLTLSGDNGDADVLIRYAAIPSPTSFDIYPAISGSNESIHVDNPPDGEFYIEIYGYEAYSNATLSVSY